MSNDTLDAKAEEIRQELEAWAEKTGILGPGKYLVFSLRIEKKTVVTRDPEDASTILEMDAEEFFTLQRFEAEGCLRQTAGRARAFVHHAAYQFTHQEERVPVYRVADFLKEFPSQRSIADVPLCGKKIAEVIVAAIRRAGLPFGN